MPNGGIRRGRGITLLDDVEAFYLEHRRCGDVENHSPEDDSRIVLTCSCGAVLNRANEDPPTSASTDA